MKIIYWRFHIKGPFTFWDMRAWDMWKVCLQTFWDNRICSILAYFLTNLQTLLANNSRILSIKNAKLSGYCFYMNTNIWRFSNLHWLPLEKFHIFQKELAWPENQKHFMLVFKHKGKRKRFLIPFLIKEAKYIIIIECFFIIP